MKFLLIYVPNLRFNNHSWNTAHLNNFAKKIIEKNKDLRVKNVISNSANFGLISQTDYFDKEIANSSNIDNYYVINKNDFVYNPRKSNSAPFGPVNIYQNDDPGVVSPLYLCFKVNKIHKKYLYYYFKSNSWHKYMYLNGDSGARSDRVSVKDEVFFRIPITYPDDANQAKISNFLDLIEDRIQTQIKIIGDYNSLKKGIIQHIFNVNYEFPNVHLKAVLKEISQKNKNRDNIDVLSVSNSLGFIKQSEQFEDREIASADTSNYKIVNKNEYAYNPARINVGSIARLQSCDCGIVSPMYTVFKTDISKISYEYFDLFLQSSTFQKQLNQKLEGSVRQCLTFASMQNILIELPPLEMQIEISEKMKFIDSKIKIESDYLNLLKTEKEYLLKNMFV